MYAYYFVPNLLKTYSAKEYVQHEAHRSCQQRFLCVCSNINNKVTWKKIDKKWLSARMWHYVNTMTWNLPMLPMLAITPRLPDAIACCNNWKQKMNSHKT